MRARVDVAGVRIRPEQQGRKGLKTLRKEVKAVGKKARKTVRREVYNSLVEQLKAKGADIALFSDLIEDYMQHWDLKELMIEDIKEHGLTKSINGVEKENPSVKQLPIETRQMLATLQQLGISADSVNGGGGYAAL